MFALPWNNRRRPFAHRCVSGLALCAYVLVAFGTPVPGQARAAKGDGRPFPCQDHPCGCSTAEECWRHCCCFTPEEKLAWARAHHVRVPSYAEKPAAEGWQTPRLRDQEAAGEEPCGRCACSSDHGARPVSQATRRPTAGAGCCEKSPDPREGRRPARTRWHLGMAARPCQGLNTVWVHGGAVVPPAPPVAWQPNLLPSCWLSNANDCPDHLPSRPPEPPPRV